MSLKYTITDPILLYLFRKFPPHSTIFKESPGRPESEYENEIQNPIYSEFFEPDAGIFADKRVLDLGCGYGGRTVRFKEYGAEYVVGLEVTADQARNAKRFTESRRLAGVDYALATGENIPVSDNFFDVIVMNDVMEHVISPAAVLRECHRVLAPGGKLALIFPPYYDLLGGSHLHGYATRIPGLNLFFTTGALKSAARKMLRHKGIEMGRFFREVPSDKLWNQNGLTVRGFKKLLRSADFQTERLILYGHLQRRLGSGILRSLIRKSMSLAARTPLIREAFCNRIIAVLRKPS